MKDSVIRGFVACLIAALLAGSGGTLLVQDCASAADAPKPLREAKALLDKTLVAKKNFRLLAGHTYYSRFFPTPEGVLVNHHSIARDGQVYFGTLKATLLDDEGTLRLGWWKGNDRSPPKRGTT